MDCNACGKSISVLDRACPHCGASATPILDGISNGRSFVSSGSAPKSSLREPLTPSRPAPESPIAGFPSPSGPAAAASGFKWKLSRSAKPPAAFLDMGGDGFWGPVDKEVFQIANFAFNSPHVQNNEAYRKRAARVTMLYASEINDVNAFATDMAHPSIAAEPPMIVLMEGLVRACRIAAVGLGWERRQPGPKARAVLVRIIRTLGRTIVNGRGTLELESARELVEKLKLETIMADMNVQTWARSFRDAMIMGIISHELGHIALSHTLGGAVNMGISRNQEREADSFAASVIASSPFSDYMIIGIIFFWLILTWADTATPTDAGRTHPHSKERLLDFIRASRDQAAAVGITEDAIAEFLPDGGAT